MPLGYTADEMTTEKSDTLFYEVAQVPIIQVSTEDELAKALAETKGSVALEFVAADCGFCQAEIPEVNKLVEECPSVTIIRADADKLVKAADKYLGDEGGTPTLFYSKTGGEKLAAVENAKAAAKFELNDSTELRRKLKCARKPRG